MRQYAETRGGYQVQCYEINITPLMKKLALDFATAIILSDNQYDRLLPSEINNIEIAKQIRIQRTYMGKLAELAFADLLLCKGINFSTAGMFQIYDGADNVDQYDFVEENGDRVDVKCGFRDIHKLLAINTEQFNSQQHKDYYVAIKLNAVDIDRNNKLVDMNSVTHANVLGYAEYSYLLENAEIRDLGEGPARILAYSRLLGIDRLLREF